MKESLLSGQRGGLPFWLRAVGLIALLMLSGVVFESHAEPRVSQALVSEDGMLVIRGRDLARHGQPIIRAGDQRLDVCAQCATNSYVVARLPDNLAGGQQPVRYRSGSYRHDFQIRLPARPALTEIADATLIENKRSESLTP